MAIPTGIARWCAFNILAWTAAAGAAVKLPAVIGDHMAIQRDQAVPIWGWAEPGEQVTVRFAGQQKTGTAGADGKWRIQLDPLPAGGPHEITIQSSNTLTIRDVLVGEVWLCSGQSNMEMPVNRSLNKDQEVAAANFPQIRLFKVKRAIANEPRSDCEGQWQVCAPETAGPFSAAGYFFGRRLHQELKVPIGLLEAAWAGTPASSWTSEAGFDAAPVLKESYQRRWKQFEESYPQRLEAYRQAMKKYETEMAQWKQLGATTQTEPHKPGQPDDPKTTEQYPSRLFNAMINPLIRYGMRGVIWYQGEGDIDYGYQYRQMFPALIRDWRQLWGQGEFPFHYVQIGGWRDVPEQPKECNFAEVRESQFLTLKTVSNTAMAVTLDISERDNVHFLNKQEVGRRLALAALARVYGQKDLEYSGPLYESFTVEGDKVRVQFTHAAGLKTRDGQSVQSLAIAGEDHKFVWAESTIDGQTLVVWSPQMPKPVAVRYAWGEYPPVNLVNGAGLPASGFRTDDWPVSTSRKN